MKQKLYFAVGDYNMKQGFTLSDAHFLLMAGWALYCILHSVLAALWFKKYVEGLIGTRYFRYYRLGYSCFAAVSLIALLVFQIIISSSRLFLPSLPFFIIGGLLSVAGLGIMVLCIRKYFFNLSGVDVLMKKQLQPVLEQHGLHAYVRHPLFSGTLLLIWSLFLIFPLLSNLIACVVITVYTLIGLVMEERKLVDEFGDQYVLYALKTPRLIPSFRKYKKSPIS